MSRRSRRVASGVAVAAVGVLLCIGAANAVGSTDGRAYTPSPGAVPRGFQPVSGGAPVKDQGLDSISKRTTVSVFSLPEGNLLVINGSHDALESALPEGAMRADDKANQLTGSKNGWQYLALRDKDGMTLNRVGMIYAPQETTMPSSAAGLVRSPTSKAAAATGDITPLLSGSDGNTVSYRSPETGDVFIVQTFPSERLDPVLKYFAPMSSEIEIGGTQAYAFDSGNGNRVIAAASKSGELVLFATTSSKVTISDLTKAAESALAN